MILTVMNILHREGGSFAAWNLASIKICCFNQGWAYERLDWRKYGRIFYGF